MRDGSQNSILCPVATLLEKIQVHAEQRLAPLIHQPPSGELAKYKQFLKIENQRLKMHHRAGGGGREICHARSELMDTVLRYVLQAVIHQANQDGIARKDFALVAYGGYGRGELNPYSDIDILFLHDGSLVKGTTAHPFLTRLTDGLLYTLWDLGLKVGHAVRSPDECVQSARDDMQTKTALLEARLITGDTKLFDRMLKLLSRKSVLKGAKAYLMARLQDQAERRSKYGNSVAMQEPNIKNGCGGLRDYQNLLWMTWVRYQVRTLGELESFGMITESEARQVETAYDFLLRTRTELHYNLNRASDVLTKAIQPTVARHLGYTDRSPSQRLEGFMREYYQHARAIHVITRTVEQRLALTPKASKKPTWREVLRAKRQQMMVPVDGFLIEDEQLLHTSKRIFQDQQRRLMRVFLHAQQRGLRIHPDTLQLIRASLPLVNRSFIEDPHVHETFLEILNQRGNVATTLRTMHEVDLLGKYLPDFGALTCLVQHEFYHLYAADEHTLMCIEMLDRVWLAESQPFNRYSEIFLSIEKPYLLYLALLLHDAGKPSSSKGGGRGTHSKSGALMAVRVGEKLNLPQEEILTLKFIIHEHLTMVHISQRRDIEDPSEIRRFIGKIRNQENLALLTLHTFADSMGTNADLWNGFKDSLLLTLYTRTMAVFRGENTRALDAEIHRNLRKQVREAIPPSFKEDEFEAHFRHLPPRYFRVRRAKGVAEDLAMVHRFMHYQVDEEDRAFEPVLAWHNEPDRGYATVKICTWDRVGLFATIAGTLTAAGLNILSAEIFSRSDGIVIDKFVVVDVKQDKIPDRAKKEAFEMLLTEALHPGREQDLERLVLDSESHLTRFRPVEEERIPTRIQFDNQTSDTRTILEVETEDRVGLLYAIASVLGLLNLDISVAKISTESGAAVDSFYIRRKDATKIEDARTQRHIINLITRAFRRLDRRNTRASSSPRKP